MSPGSYATILSRRSVDLFFIDRIALWSRLGFDLLNYAEVSFLYQPALPQSCAVGHQTLQILREALKAEIVVGEHVAR